MKIPISIPRLKGFRYSREIIAYSFWAYHRFAFNAADVEDLLAGRGVIASAKRSGFGSFGLANISQISFIGIVDGQKTSGIRTKWSSRLRGNKLWLWRAFDASGKVLDIAAANPPEYQSRKSIFSKTAYWCW